MWNRKSWKVLESLGKSGRVSESRKVKKSQLQFYGLNCYMALVHGFVKPCIANCFSCCREDKVGKMNFKTVKREYMGKFDVIVRGFK